MRTLRSASATQPATVRLPVLRPIVALVAALLVCTMVSPVASPMASAAPAYTGEVEDYAGYEPQTKCAKKVKPGTAYLLRWLVEEYPNTRAGSTLRSCSGSSVSEHKDGRALDWGANASNRPQRRAVKRFLARIFATDVEGNTHALARRMGIMYLIWNDRMYASYRQFEKRDYLSSGCRTQANCSQTLRHRDHVHISLSRRGAAGLTSFYPSA